MPVKQLFHRPRLGHFWTRIAVPHSGSLGSSQVSQLGDLPARAEGPDVSTRPTVRPVYSKFVEHLGKGYEEEEEPRGAYAWPRYTFRPPAFTVRLTVFTSPLCYA
jgi:hypothetical protein